MTYYNPYYSQPFLPQFTQNQPTQNSPTTNVGWVYVNGMEGARNQIVQPGNTSWMMDNSDPVMYVKSVDSMGTATLKAFKLEEISGQEKKQSDNYITRPEFDEIKQKMTKLEELIGGINA